MELEKTRLVAGSLPICDWCLGRQFTKNIMKAEQIGVLTRGKPYNGPCTFCNNAYIRRKEIAKEAAEALEKYEFSTFSIGIIIGYDKINAEDEIRSKLKLHSGIAIKRALVSLFRKELHVLLKKEVVVWNGEALLIIDLVHQTFHIETRSVGLLVRYVKLQRGIRTRGIKCLLCKGSGCDQCDFTGMSKEVPSVEFEVVRHFKSVYGASKVKITWSGTEDDNSLVLGKGRPIFVHIINPMLRKSGFDRVCLSINKKIQFTEVRVMDSKPPVFDQLKKIVLYRLKLRDNLTDEQIRSLEDYFSDREATAHAGKKRRVYNLGIKQNLNESVTMTAEMDNGLSPWLILGLKEESDIRTVAEIIPRANIIEADYDIIDFKT
ncbi:MAG: hypothetical protein QXT39_05030 [Conexivisphaerales archaeon]